MWTFVLQHHLPNSCCCCSEISSFFKDEVTVFRLIGCSSLREQRRVSHHHQCTDAQLDDGLGSSLVSARCVAAQPFPRQQLRTTCHPSTLIRLSCCTLSWFRLLHWFAGFLVASVVRLCVSLIYCHSWTKVCFFEL